jgi:hypothetical protein
MKFTQEHDESFNGVEGWKIRPAVYHQAYFAYPGSSVIIVNSIGVTLYDYRESLLTHQWFIDKPLTIAEANVLISLYEKMEDSDLVSMIKLTASYEAF